MAPSKEKKFVSDNALLLAEWDFEKNITISPEKITYGSAKKAWWICSICGYRWESSIYSRGANGCGCPECARINRGLSKKKTAAKTNRFIQQFPHIAQEWHPTKNKGLCIENVSSFSNIKAWWKCAECGYEWETTVNHRTTEGNMCPICSRKRGSVQKTKTHAERNNFALQRPMVAQEWHPYKNGTLKATDVSVKSNKKVWWLCDYCGYEWETTVNHRSAGHGCPQCSMAQTSFAEQVVYYYVKQVFPDAINRYQENLELDVFIPSQRIAIEYDGFYYHQSKSALAQDNKKDEYCCENNIKLFRFRSPRLEDTVSATRITYEEYNLEKGIYELLSLISSSPSPDVDIERDSNRILEQFRCIETERSIASKKPHLLKEWHPSKNGGINPKAVYAFSNKKIWWKCANCGYEWKTTVNHRANGQGCPICARKHKKAEG